MTSNDPQPLASAFVARGGGAPDDALEALLREHVSAARAAWPGVAVDDIDFVRHLADRAGADRGTVASLHTSDLFLAHACACGDRAATQAFARLHLARVPEYLARMHVTPDFCDEVRQILSEKLLTVRGDLEPTISDYSGRGPLAAWLRVAAVRTALNLKAQRREEPEEKGDIVAQILRATSNPELDYMRRRYAAEFTEALREAFAALSPDQRLVLRMHVTKGLTGDQIANTLKIHRATVVRWIARAREDILRHATTYLRERVRLSRSEIESLVGLLGSHVDMSFSQLLGVTNDSPR